ncbi:MAG: hypothetical protein OER88_15060, partial [Planctomycetota bacterium]|nr:hypothetical protein [Planctomycetota bacterium]
MKLLLSKTLAATLLGLAALAVSAEDAAAETISMTQSAAVFVDAGGNFSLGETFFFPQFDRDIGELLKVTFTATILVSNEVDL